jgi:hypothetical protein
MSTIASSSQSATSQTRNTLEDYARKGLWALPVYTVLLFLGTLTHQPPYQTDFPAYARYVTTTEFLISHLVASILGAAIGILGFIALFIILCKGRTAALALWGLVAGVIANTLITAVVGVAAFAQPAIGRAYLSGHMAGVVALNNDVYGTVPLNTTGLAGFLLLTIGIICFGVAVIRSGPLPKLAGIGLVVGIVLFAPIGFFAADIVQSIGAALLVASTVWIAIAGWQTLRAS